MSPILYFDELWRRCAALESIYRYVSTNVTAAINSDELLRAEWVARVSALDLYVHELIFQNMSQIFLGMRPPTEGFNSFQISNDTLMRVRTATSASEASEGFELEIRRYLGRKTFQYPEDIAAAVRLISTCELWNEIALHNGSSATKKSDDAKILKKSLSLIIERRNKIAHEGDLGPATPRTAWLISREDVDYVAFTIEKIVRSIDAVII